MYECSYACSFVRGLCAVRVCVWGVPRTHTLMFRVCLLGVAFPLWSQTKGWCTYCSSKFHGGQAVNPAALSPALNETSTACSTPCTRHTGERASRRRPQDHSHTETSCKTSGSKKHKPKPNASQRVLYSSICSLAPHIGVEVIVFFVFHGADNGCSGCRCNGDYWGPLRRRHRVER